MSDNLNTRQFANTHDVVYKYDKRDNPYGAEPPEGLSMESYPHFRGLAFHHLVADRQDSTPEHLAKITEDVARHGVRQPIGIDHSTTPPTVSDGHTRLIAAYLAGHRRVPIVERPLKAGFEVGEPRT